MDIIRLSTGTALLAGNGIEFDMMKCQDPNVWFIQEQEWSQHEQRTGQRFPWTEPRLAFITLEHEAQKYVGTRFRDDALNRLNERYDTLSGDCIHQLVRHIQVFLKMRDAITESRGNMDYLCQNFIPMHRFLWFEKYSERVDCDLDSQPRYRDFHRECKRHSHLLQLYIIAMQNLSKFQTLYHAEASTADANTYTNILRKHAVDELTKLNEDAGERDKYLPTYNSDEKSWLKRRKESGRLGPGWVRVDNLNTGGFSHVDIWAKQDPKGNIIDRVAVKEINCKNENGEPSEMWEDANEWVVDDRVDGGRVPMEVKIMYNLRKMRSDSIVKIRGWHVSSSLKHQRILMEYCPYGDLDTMKNRHYDDRTMVPEPFLWWTFENLAQAGIELENCMHECGQCRTTIIHSDLKPANIYGGLPSKTHFKGYPTPKLGDFGLSFYEDPKKKEWGRGTRGHRAPEQKGHLFEPNHAYRNQTSKTNVWGVGMIIWCMMHRRDGDRASEFSTNYQQPTFEEEVENYYSYELVALVSRCLTYLPELRPDFNSILIEVRCLTDPRSSEDLCMGLRDLPEDDERWEEGGVALRYLADDIRIGLPLEEVMGNCSHIPQHPRLLSDQVGNAPEVDIVHPGGGEFVINE